MALTRLARMQYELKSAHKSDECSYLGCFPSGVEPLQSINLSASDQEILPRMYSLIAWPRWADDWNAAQLESY